ncbi:hypothetical protein INT48_004213 [Thamnidium elegans]|uniref:RING-type E3 ubiquitin transferase n=1 Tax=Thamnidium elegans TaxID=101142 RepID=A0A8H7SIX2_9FUNG|nr:hypothetical protein INT48_004213 [Thamnidium elegans]
MSSLVGWVTAHIILMSNNDTHIDKAAAFGPSLTKEGVIGNMFPPPKESKQGCNPIEAAPCENWIAIIERGGCSFVDKVRTLQTSGAKAVIIGDRHYNGWITMYATGDSSDITIPSVYVAQYQFLSLLQHLNGKPVSIKITENELFSWSWSDLLIFFSVLLPSSILYAVYLTWRVRQQHIQKRELAPSDVVKRLPIHSFHREKDIPIDECIICLEEYQEGDKIRTLPCKHEFHSACVDLWLITRKKKYQATENTPLLLV